MGTGIPCKMCVIYTGYLTHGNSKGERGSRHKNNSRIVTDLGEKNVGTKRKCPRQGLTIAEDLTIELLEGRESPPTPTIDQINKLT